jgi:hypothetical protein
MKSSREQFLEEREDGTFPIPIRKPGQLNKKQLTAQAEEFVTNMLANTDPLHLIVDIKRLEEFVAAMKAKVSAAVSNLDDPQIVNGAKVEMMGARETWSFDHSPRWKELSEALKEYEGLMKKANTPGITIVDENGEEVPAAVRKMGNPFLKITL